MTVNGKLDQSLLPAPGIAAAGRPDFEPPIGENEEILAAIWSELLQVGRVGRFDSFFDLGGHSLLLVRMMGRLHDNGRHVDAAVVFNSPTLIDLAKAVVQRDAFEAASLHDDTQQERGEITPESFRLVRLDQAQISEIARSAGGAENVQDIYPLTSFQEGLLFHSLLSEDADPYVVSVIFKVSSRTQMERMLRGLQNVVDRHDLARSSVCWKGLPQPVQVVHRTAQLPIDHVELDSDQHVLEQLEGWVRANPRSISVQHSPLMRAVIAQKHGRDECFLLFQFHHLIVDHASLEIMQGEVLANVIGNVEALSRPVPFRSFVAQISIPRDTTESENYFRSAFAHLPERLPAFGLRDVHGNGHTFREAVLELDENLAGRLRAAARRMNVTVAALFHVAWAIVLGRCGAGKEVVFGTVLSGRLQGTNAAERMFGNCINTLPVRIRLGHEGIVDVVQQTHYQLGKLLKFEHVSLAAAQRWTGYSSSTPLFTAVLNYRHSKRHYRSRYANIEPAAQGISVLAVRERANYPLGLQVDDLDKSFVLTVLTHASVEPERIANYVRESLAQVAELLETAPQTATDSVSPVSVSERTWLLHQFNQTTALRPAKLVHELVSEQAEQDFHTTAVLCERSCLSRRQLDLRSNQLARYLQECSVGPDVVVGVAVSRSAEFVMAALGILKAGGAFLPLDPDWPIDRWSTMCDDANAQIIVTENRFCGVFAANSRRIIRLDTDRDEIAEKPTLPPECKATSANLAYVIFTSGSSGRPKGVAIEHHSVLNFLMGINSLLPVASGARQSWWSSSGFDVSIYEIFSALLYGRELHIVPDRVRLDPDLFIDWLITSRIESAYVPSHALNALLDAASRSTRELRLKRLLVGVEPIAEDLLCRLRASLGEVEIVNAYGPAETTVCATAYLVPREAQNEFAPIGRPLGNVRTYVLDEALEPVPFGAVGELYIGGTGVGRGYINQPELAAASFLSSPFVGRDRLYKTGDRARYLPDGNLQFLGRLDRQVKVRGNRIELDEISENLRRHPGVSEAAAALRERSGGDPYIVAYFVQAGEADIGQQLRDYLVRKLPNYMVPQHFVRVPSMPLTPSGKLDLKALSKLDLSSDHQVRDPAPEGALEHAIAQVWLDLLKVYHVGRYDNFFDVGGDSLLAIRLVGRLRTLLPQLSLESLYRCPTIASQAEFLRGREIEA